jgi:ABC-type transporter Mla maintaining outer membrane lipid asymmetry ATPase subunit MlaF
MNPDQRYIFDHIMEKVRLAEESCFFVDGCAGRGKTFLMAAICGRVRSDRGIICIVGTTALSVIHYDRGRTAHSTFGIPVQESDVGLESKVKVVSQ